MPVRGPTAHYTIGANKMFQKIWRHSEADSGCVLPLVATASLFQGPIALSSPHCEVEFPLCDQFLIVAHYVATFAHGAFFFAKLLIDKAVDMTVRGPLGIKPSAPG